MSSMTRSGLRPSVAAAAAKPPTKAASSEPFEQIARGIVADVDEKIGSRDARGERAGRVVALAFGAAIDVRGGGEIGRADVVAAAFLADQRSSTPAP